MNFILYLLDFPSGRSPPGKLAHSLSREWVWKTSGTSWSPARKLSHFATSGDFPIFFHYPNIPHIFSLFLSFWNNYSFRNKRVCIDLSCWMVRLHNVNKSHAPMKEKIYLTGLFHRLRALIALNCTLIFVTGMCVFHFVFLQFWIQM